MLDATSYRSLFPITEQHAYFDHAGVSPLSTRVVQAISAFNDLAARAPLGHHFEDVFNQLNDLRTRAARLINARSVDEIALVPNTATGINIAALSLPLRAGGNVLVVDGDYPANIYPWMNLAHRGVLTKVVPQHNGGLDLDLLVSRIDPRTSAIAVSTVMFATGYRNDIEAIGRICRDRGIFLVVDGIQSLGVLPFDVQAANIDILACGSQKWLMGPIGGGFMYVRQEILNDLVPGAYVGAGSTVDSMNFLDYNFTLLPTAERFNIGSPNIMGMIGLRASLEILQDIGIEHVAEHVLALNDRAIVGLQERGFTIVADTTPERRSGIVIVAVDDPAMTCARLREHGIHCIARGKGIRIAPHFYNTADEIDRLIDAMSA